MQFFFYKNLYSIKKLYILVLFSEKCCINFNDLKNPYERQNVFCLVVWGLASLVFVALVAVVVVIAVSAVVVVVIMSYYI